MVIFNGAKKCKIRLFSKICSSFGVFLAWIGHIFKHEPLFYLL
jgi:hypothetical protein